MSIPVDKTLKTLKYNGITIPIAGGSGVLNIINNGTHDVSQYASADVAVPSPSTPMKFYGFREWDYGTTREYGATSSDEGWTNYQGVTLPSIGDLIVVDITGQDSKFESMNYQNIIRVKSIEDNAPKGDVIAQIRKGEVLGLTYAKEEQSKTAIQNGTVYPDDGKVLSSVVVNVPSSGVQYSASLGKATNKTTYTAVGGTITVKETGNYKCSWVAFAYAAGSSSTYATQLYSGSTAVGRVHNAAAYTASSGFVAVENSIALTAGQTIGVRARTRSGTSYWTVAGMLVIEKV